MVTEMAAKKDPDTKPGVLQNISNTISGWLSQPIFFTVILAVFLFQSLWIALSARYPQAFDEQYHFGLIQLHAQQWLPFFSSHPFNAEVYGPVSRDPSYFFHFLLSLPYRLLEAMTTSQTIQVVALRFINIAFFVAGLFVFRKLLIELGVSRRLQHVVLLFFVLTPVVPLLASQINYDNLFFLLTGLALLYMVRFMRQLSTAHTLNVDYALRIILFGLIMSITTYAALPLFAGVAIAILVAALLRFRKDGRIWKLFTWGNSRVVVITFAVLTLLFTGLFVERYGINIVRYHTPVPDCALVLTDQQCESYAPWARDHMFAQTYPRPTAQGIAVYPFVWIHRMVFETMFVISSRFDTDGATVIYVPAPPLTVANYTAWFIVIAGGGLAVFYWRKIWRLPYMPVLLGIIAFYGVVLFLKNAGMYLHTGEAVAIHGRYFVILYPVIYLLPALGFSWFFNRIKRSYLKPLFGVVVLLCFLQGAGLVGWIFRSDPSWYWSSVEDVPVYQVNHTVQNVVHRVVIP